MHLEKRHLEEQEYWDNQIQKVLNNQNYEIHSLSNFETLATKISYFKPIIPFWGEIINKTILDLACGDGWISLSLGKSGANVYGFDISPRRIELANHYARHNGLSKKIQFDVMTSEEMIYEDNFFDFAIMHAALHHCDIEQTSKQLHRVLKPGGKAVLIEDYAHHPLMRLYRALTPTKHTEHEKALDEIELKTFVSNFSSYSYQYHGLLNIFEISNNKIVNKIKPVLNHCDNMLCKVIPLIKKYSKIIEIFVVK